jgi:thiamine pyrophosphokinase
MQLSWLARVLPAGLSSKRALILLNTPMDAALVETVWHMSNFKICADGAADRLLSVHPSYVPDAIVGDMDSASPESLNHYRSLGCDIIDLSVDQDTTDLDKSLSLASLRGYNDAVIIGQFSSGRVDHTFSIIQSLFRAQKPNGRFEEISVISETTMMKLLLPTDDGVDDKTDTKGNSDHSCAISSHRLETIIGGTCGLIPIAGRCSDVSTEGLKWELSHAALGFGDRVSTSNMALSTAVVVHANGPLIWTMTRPEGALIAENG